MTNSANGGWLRLSLYVSCTAIAATLLSAKLLAQAGRAPGFVTRAHRSQGAQGLRRSAQHAVFDRAGRGL